MKFNIGSVVSLTQMLMDSYSSEHFKQNKLKKHINLSGHKQSVENCSFSCWILCMKSTTQTRHLHWLHRAQKAFPSMIIFLKAAPYIVKCNMATTLLQSQNRDSHAYWLKPAFNQLSSLQIPNNCHITNVFFMTCKNNNFSLKNKKSFISISPNLKENREN